MRAFLAVARREFAEKRFVFFAAAAASLVPIAVPLVRHLSGAPAQDARAFTALILAGTVGAGLAVVLGATVLAGETASRRIGFYFSRPVSALALWAGKLSASLAVVLAALAVVLGPTLIVNGSFAPLRDLLPLGAIGATAAVAAFFLFLLLFANAAGIATRSRSPLLAVDIVALALVALLFWNALARLLRFTEVPAASSRIAFFALGGLGLIAMLAATHRAVARGRTDVRAAHGALSATLWALLGIAAAGFESYSLWALSAPPSALSRVQSASEIGSSGWTGVSGRARGLWASFLYDTKTGAYERTGFSAVAVSGDGRTAAWVDAPGPRGPWTVRTLRLDRPREGSTETRLSFSQEPYGLTLSPDGGRVAAFQQGVLSIAELPSGRSLGSARLLEWRDAASGFFRTPDVFRVLARRAGAQGTEEVRLEIVEFRTATKKVAVTGVSETLKGNVFVQTSADGERIVTRERGGSRITLRDGKTAAILATLREGPDIAGAWPFFLSDGRCALALYDSRSASIEIFSAAGAKEKSIPLPGGGRIRTGFETAPGQIAVSLEREPVLRGSPQSNPTLYLVDADRGVAKPAAGDLRPIALPLSGRSRPAPGSEASKLFLSSDGTLVRFDPLTGQPRVVLGNANKN
ncbi:MAG: hypothetical protein M3R62_10585 [Acidobacteriota bacterium]|nr:hypothetical protein [Acidobacteriota bacterium]